MLNRRGLATAAKAATLAAETAALQDDDAFALAHRRHQDVPAHLAAVCPHTKLHLCKLGPSQLNKLSHYHPNQHKFVT